MKQAIESIWGAIEKTKDLYAKNGDIFFDVSESKKASFDQSFRKTYNEIKEKYMQKNVKSLDRHKVAAIIIFTILNENIITSKKELQNDTIFLGAEMISISIGLSYMQRALNDVLRKLDVPKTINGYHMPAAFACETSYFDIFARNLYFSKRDYVLNPLDIADKLFLLEYLTLKNEMIDPRSLTNEDC